MEKRLGIAVDIGASRVRACVGDSEGRMLWRKSVRLVPPERSADLVKGIVGLVQEAARRIPPGSSLGGVGVASVGPLDLKRGGMSSPANLPYGFVPLVGPISRRFQTGVTLINDANAAALGEKRFGAGKAFDDLAYVTLSTGIGGGAIVDGHLLSGKDGNAPEVGHIVVDPEGRLECGCGGKGHWEAYCSGRGIPRFAALVGGNEFVRRDAKAILHAAAEGDRLASKVVRSMGAYNAQGIANVVNMLDPSLVTIGGGVALNNPDMILAPIKRQVGRFSINRVPEIRITPLGDDAGLLGALSLACGGIAP